MPILSKILFLWDGDVSATVKRKRKIGMNKHSKVK